MQEEIENMRSLNGKTLGNWQDWNTLKTPDLSMPLEGATQ